MSISLNWSYVTLENEVDEERLISYNSGTLPGVTVLEMSGMHAKILLNNKI